MNILCILYVQSTMLHGIDTMAQHIAAMLAKVNRWKG